MADFPASIDELIYSYPNGNATLDYHHFATSTPAMSDTETTVASGVYSSPATVFGVLVTFSLCTVFGNSLVMLAVKREHYLQSPPNYFVASLAAADFFVGVLLIPFEAITQLLNRRWIFGDIWCDLWHSFDVLFATASILNLCVISLDRYWAICTPFSYSRRMTSKRAYRFIALVWICAIVISLPAIFWWRSVREGPVLPGTCPFTDDVSYLISSSIVSFYIPLSVMLFAYYKIYKAAAFQSRSIQQGAKQFAVRENGTEKITLRMHRGGSNGQNGVMANTNGGKSPSANPSNKNIFFGRSDPSGLSMMNFASGASGVSSPVKAVNYKTKSKFVRNTGKRTFSEPSVQPERKMSPSSPEAIPTMSDDENPEMLVESKVTAAVHLISQPLLMITTATAAGNNTNSVTYEPNAVGRGGSSNVPSVTFRNTRRSFTVAKKLAKFAKEKKAAKTLAIVLGVFIICWLPFFVINIVFAVCKSCAEGQMVTFEVVTWLGWINSAMNPVIYACWSHDFRRAFARLLCCGRCARARRQRQTQRRLSVV